MTCSENEPHDGISRALFAALWRLKQEALLDPAEDRAPAAIIHVLILEVILWWVHRMEQQLVYHINNTSILKCSAIEEQNNRKRCPVRLPHQSKPWIKQLSKNSWTAVSHDADNLMESNSVVFPCPQTWFTWLGTRRPSPPSDWASAADSWGPH